MFHAPLVSSRPTLQRIPAQGNGRRLLRRKGQVLAAMGEVIDAGVATGKYVQGPRVAALEQLMANRWQVPAAVAVNSGTSALHLSLSALQLPAGGEVLVPALSFISTAYAISAAGLVPVFVDVDAQTWTLPQLMRPSRGKRSRWCRCICTDRWPRCRLCWLWQRATGSR